jgi:hypothetical protein
MDLLLLLGATWLIAAMSVYIAEDADGRLAEHENGPAIDPDAHQ